MVVDHTMTAIEVAVLSGVVLVVTIGVVHFARFTYLLSDCPNYYSIRSC